LDPVRSSSFPNLSDSRLCSPSQKTAMNYSASALASPSCGLHVHMRCAVFLPANLPYMSAKTCFLIQPTTPHPFLPFHSSFFFPFRGEIRSNPRAVPPPSDRTTFFQQCGDYTPSLRHLTLGTIQRLASGSNNAFPVLLLIFL